MTARPARPGRPFAARLMVAQGLVVTAGALTAALVAALAGPPIFHQHLIETGHAPDSPELVHIEEAYASASDIALAAALAIALAAAFAVTWYLSRRLAQPFRELDKVAASLSRGDYSARVPDLSGGPELDRLGATFNDVAARLETTEDTRRRLLADLAHEMRTPLATIEAYLDGLEDEVTSWGPPVARVLRDQTNRLVRLAEDLAEVSTAEEGRLHLTPQATPVVDLVWSAAQGVRTDYQAKGVNLVIGDPALGRRSAVAGLAVSVDRQRILQVLTNLLTNALRHTPPGGTVTIRASAGPREVHLDVTDTGDGIRPDQLPHLFERFYRGDTARDRDHGGSGIGLTIARSIALAHRGSLEADSEGAGRGARFRLSLPMGLGPSLPPRRDDDPLRRAE